MRHSVLALHQPVWPRPALGGPQEFRESDLKGQGPCVTVQVGGEEGPSQPGPPASSCQLWGGPPGRLDVNRSRDVHFPQPAKLGPGSVGTPRPTQAWGRLQAAERSPALLPSVRDPALHRSTKHPCNYYFIRLHLCLRLFPGGPRAGIGLPGPILVHSVHRGVSEQWVSDPHPWRAPGCVPSFW